MEFVYSHAKRPTREPEVFEAKVEKMAEELGKKVGNSKHGDPIVKVRIGRLNTMGGYRLEFVGESLKEYSQNEIFALSTFETMKELITFVDGWYACNRFYFW